MLTSSSLHQSTLCAFKCVKQTSLCKMKQHHIDCSSTGCAVGADCELKNLIMSICTPDPEMNYSKCCSALLFLAVPTCISYISLNSSRSSDLFYRLVCGSTAIHQCCWILHHSLVEVSLALPRLFPVIFLYSGGQDQKQPFFRHLFWCHVSLSSSPLLSDQFQKQDVCLYLLWPQHWLPTAICWACLDFSAQL